MYYGGGQRVCWPPSKIIGGGGGGAAHTPPLRTPMLMVSLCAVFFPRNVLGEICDLIESVSEDFPTYFYLKSSINF